MKLPMFDVMYGWMQFIKETTNSMTFWGNARISLLNFVLDNRFRTEGVQGTVLEVPVQGTCAVVQKDASTVCD